jgi:hypothetical protein
VRTVARALLGPFLLLIVANVSGSYGFLYGPYLGAGAAVLAFALPEPLVCLPAVRRRPPWLCAGVATGLGWVFAVLLPWLVTPDVTLRSPVVMVLLVLAAAAVNLQLEWSRWEEPARTWTAARFLLTLAVAAAVAVLQVLAVLEVWWPVK